MSNDSINTRYHLPENFYQDIEQILKQTPEGVGEYELLQLLKEKGYFSFSTQRPAPPLDLFQMHFLLFHALYRLQLECLQQESAVVEISPLNIRLLPYVAGQIGITAADPLRDYYLDITNLENMSEKEVAALIETFWRNFVRFDGRAEALAELGLSDPVEDDVIKQAYRRLAMQHHPDRGGEAWRLQAINAAYEMLCKPKS
ncbi:MAG: DNA-J related domain-containing protein [Thiohalophilus sp.]|uniref:DNA-J related domain-containing protein n=1 Tax=Thiohalophilus sp. TaxID=3028392 RepID=UPI002870112D|nr:DNA-J related domain-containing protein [Thiohalophilus sp.]MDR9436294.1 DNA-J related domain-containing protein [Thiohalophilus sp.]